MRHTMQQWMAALALGIGASPALALDVLGDFGWEDVNRNGLQDVGEPGIPGVYVRVAGDGCLGHPTLFHSAMTDADGHYEMQVSRGSRCHLEFLPPSGPDYRYEPTDSGVWMGYYDIWIRDLHFQMSPNDSDLGGSLNYNATPDFDVPLTPIYYEDNWSTAVDAGFVKWVDGGLTGVVWNDVDHNGRRDPAELGLPGVTVDLLVTLVDVGASVITDADGRFSFGDLRSDWNYILRVQPLPGFEFTLANVGDELLDNDFSGDGRLFFRLDSAEQRTYTNAGLYNPLFVPAPGSSALLLGAAALLAAARRRAAGRARQGA